MAEKVAIMNCPAYDVDSIEGKLREALEALRVELPSRARVLVKPNIVSQNTPEQCTCTHPAVVEAICLLLAERNCAIAIGESSAFYERGYTDRGFVTSGIARVAAKFGAELVAFERDGVELARNPLARELTSVLIARRLREVDFVIDAAKLKTHGSTGMSGAVKNLLGFVPGGAKFEYHYAGTPGRAGFGERIADVFDAVRPGLSVLDAVCGLEGPGPSSLGRPKRTGVVMVSGNPWAIDFLAARMIGLDPYSYEILQAGLARGFLQNPESIEATGDFSEPPYVPYQIPAPSKEPPREKNLLYRLIGFVPTVRKGACHRCGHCAEACPVGAIAFDGVPVIDLSKCLHCYHCAYACPAGAIRLKGLTPWNGLAMALRKLLGI